MLSEKQFIIEMDKFYLSVIARHVLNSERLLSILYIILVLYIVFFHTFSVVSSVDVLHSFTPYLLVSFLFFFILSNFLTLVFRNARVQVLGVSFRISLPFILEKFKTQSLNSPFSPVFICRSMVIAISAIATLRSRCCYKFRHRKEVYYSTATKHIKKIFNIYKTFLLGFYTYDIYLPYVILLKNSIYRGLGKFSPHKIDDLELVINHQRNNQCLSIYLSTKQASVV